MSNTRNILLMGGAAAAVLTILAASSKKPEEAETRTDAEDEGLDPIAAAGFNPQNYVSTKPEMGRVYQAGRGDLMLGTCDKSIAYLVIKDAAELQGIPHAHEFACDTSLRVAYAALILAAPANRIHLTCELRRKDFRNPQGYGIDLRTKPLLWLPIIDLEMLEQGIVQAAQYDEDGSLGIELPPELRKVLS